jgi:hypothetical protein
MSLLNSFCVGTERGVWPNPRRALFQLSTIKSQVPLSGLRFFLGRSRPMDLVVSLNGVTASTPDWPSHSVVEIKPCSGVIQLSHTFHQRKWTSRRKNNVKLPTVGPLPPAIDAPGFRSANEFAVPYRLDEIETRFHVHRDTSPSDL